MAQRGRETSAVGKPVGAQGAVGSGRILELGMIPREALDRGGARPMRDQRPKNARCT